VTTIPGVEPTPDETETSLRTSGQRRVNLLWEITQSVIALGITLRVILGEATDTELLAYAFFLVIGFYFGRTNHQRTGGVGPNDGGR
jgi:hypothetical protein